MRRLKFPAELRVPALTLIVVVPLLIGVSLGVYNTIVSSRAYLRQLRVAQIQNYTILQLQVDEESGLRGYSNTGDPRFLEPYRAAEEQLPAALAEHRALLEQLAVPGAAALADDERSLHQSWLANVATPLLARPAAGRANALTLRGKQLIDAFRSDHAQLQGDIDAALREADERTTAAIGRTLALGVFSTAIVLILAALFGYFQAQARRRVFEAIVLYESEKRIADSLQTAFLQKDLPLSPTVGLHATYVPASEEALVGGDWYDAFELPDGRILFSIGDVAGHGIEAAVAMSRARQAIVAAALHEDDPATVLARANTSIMLQEARLVTAICGYIDPRTLEVAYATAGHPAPILARPGAPSEFLPQGGIALGIVADAQYRTFLARAFDGAVIVFYTDGVLEHKRDVIEGQDRLLEAARVAAAEDNPATAIHRIVFSDTAPNDDVAILTVKFKRTSGTSKVAATVSAMQIEHLEISGE